ncbi:MAG: DUF4399 domain-containing protein [Rubrivivax sp.]
MHDLIRAGRSAGQRGAGVAPQRKGAIVGRIVGLALMAAGAVQAAPLPSGELELRCWLSHTRERTRVNLRETSVVEFSNLFQGGQVRSPFAVDFAIRGMGVAPAGVKLDGTGHHHILVNRTLPASVTEKLPFDDSHRHFGKGQTGTLLDLPPGKHRLRLLFADHDHRPYYLFSREVEVTVRGPRSSTARPKIDAAQFADTCAAWYADELATPPPPDEPLRFLNVRANEPLVSPFALRLGVNGFGVCAASAKAEKSGHFVLELMDGARRPVQTFALVNGTTQLNLFINVGDYIARLRLVAPDGSDLAPANEMPLRVVRREAG